jgi:hypothetical protein
VAVVAKVANVAMVKGTGSPPFDVDGTAMLAQRRGKVNIGIVPQVARVRGSRP